jgi:hypothetical protein
MWFSSLVYSNVYLDVFGLYWRERGMPTPTTPSPTHRGLCTTKWFIPRYMLHCCTAAGTFFVDDTRSLYHTHYYYIIVIILYFFFRLCGIRIIHIFYYIIYYAWVYCILCARGSEQGPPRMCIHIIAYTRRAY